MQLNVRNWRSGLLLLAAAIVLAAIAVGCGGGASGASAGDSGKVSDSTAASESSTPTSDDGSAAGDTGETSSASLTKAQFIKLGDAICDETDQRQEAGYKAYLKEHGSKDQSTKAGQERIVTEVGLPPIQKEIEELRALDAPVGEEDKVDAIVEGAEAALKESEANPASALKGPGGPFTEVEGLVTAFGFKLCGLA